MRVGLLKRLRHPVILLPVLGLLAACSLAEENIGEFNQGLVLWAIEVEVTEPIDRLFSQALAPYSMAPGLLPMPPGVLPRTGQGVTIEPVRLRRAEEIFLRGEKTQVFWYAVPVFRSDIFALAFFAESGFFERSHFTTSQRIPIANELNPSSSPRTYEMSHDVPLIKVARGEAVYIGTFTATLTPGTRSFTGTRRIRGIQRSYRIDQADAEGIVAELDLNPDRLRYVNVFRGKKEALRRYRGTVVPQ